MITVLVIHVVQAEYQQITAVSQAQCVRCDSCSVGTISNGGEGQEFKLHGQMGESEGRRKGCRSMQRFLHLSLHHNKHIYI